HQNMGAQPSLRSVQLALKANKPAQHRGNYQANAHDMLRQIGLHQTEGVPSIHCGVSSLLNMLTKPAQQSFVPGATAAREGRWPCPIFEPGAPSAGIALHRLQPAAIDEIGRASRIAGLVRTQVDRSEEHTSELESRENLVCRLRLEK